MIIIIFVFVAIGFSAARIYEESLVNRMTAEQLRITSDFAIRVAPYLKNHNAAKIYKIALEAGYGNEGRLLVTDEAAIVQIDGFSQLNGRRLTHIEINDVLSGAKQNSYGFYKINGSNGEFWAANYVSAIVYNQNIIGALVFTKPLSNIITPLREIIIRIMIVLAAAIILIVVLSLVFSRYITKPLLAFQSAMHNMSHGKFDKRINVQGRSEFAQLANVFNMMSDRLESLDAMRGEFVSNASHELKTPLSTIKILLETIIYDENPSPAIVREFMEDINKEINRMNNIINDLLTLTQIEQYEMAEKTESLLLGGVLEKIVRYLSPIAKSRSIELKLEVQDECIILCDAIKLEMAISNLVDNAIKYSPDGASVKVTSMKNGDKAIITIADNGVGIPEGDIPHIFDRFYRVDKARSRDTGGTGLGLSIAQRIILMHAGTIGVASKEGKGTTFTVVLPLKEEINELE